MLGEANLLVVFWRKFFWYLELLLLSHVIDVLIRYRILDWNFSFLILKPSPHFLPCCYWEVWWHSDCKFLYMAFFSFSGNCQKLLFTLGVLKFLNNVPWYRSFFNWAFQLKERCYFFDMFSSISFFYILLPTIISVLSSCSSSYWSFGFHGLNL